MDIPQTLSQLDKRAGELLKKKLDEQEDHFALLGEDGQIPQTLKEELRTKAFQEALAEPETVTAQITFQLIEGWPVVGTAGSGHAGYSVRRTEIRRGQPWDTNRSTLPAPENVSRM